MRKMTQIGSITLSVIFSICLVSWGANNCPPNSTFAITKLEAEDSGTTAGTRKSSSTLKMVNTGTRSASITATINGTPKTGSPTWSGTAGITGTAGDMNATYSGQVDSTVTCNAENDEGCSDSEAMNIKIVSELKYSRSWNFNEAKLKDIKDKINSAINKVKGGTGENLTVSGNMAVEFKRVDKYNDGSNYGYYGKLDGTISGSFSDISFTSPSFVIATGVSISLTGSFTASSIVIDADATYDQSKQNAGTLTGTISGSTTASMGATAIIGVANIAGVSVAVTGSTKLTASGTIALNQETVTASGTVGASKFTVTGVGQLETIFGTFEVVNETHIFDYSVSEDFSATLHTFS